MPVTTMYLGPNRGNRMLVASWADPMSAAIIGR